MDADRWARIRRLFDEAATRSLPEREAFLRAECGDDHSLLFQVESLLAADAAPSGLLSRAIGDAAAELVTSVHVGQRVGAYVLEREIGHGGMGAVFLGRRADQEYEAAVAIKLVRGIQSEEHLRRFRAERQILARLHHPNIARLLDGGTTGGGLPYLVMEHVDGEPIDAFSTARGLDLRETVALFRRVCAAVDHAHRALVVHRDIKPSNVLVTADGTPKLLDFGIAKLVDPSASGETTTLQLMTPAYASPEQILGEPIGVASDIYSLGVLLYRLLTGQAPYDVEGASAATLARIVLEHEPARPSTTAGLAPETVRALRGDLDAIVLTALRKEPEHRYATAAQLADDLANHFDGRPVTARPATAGYRLRKLFGRHRVAVVGIAAAVMTIVGLSVVYARNIAHERDTAQLDAQRAQQVTGFLQNIFTGADPTRTHGDSLTLLQVVNEGRARLDTALAGQPEVRSRLLTTLGAVYANLGRLRAADSAYLTALRLSDSLNGQNAPDRATILYGRGQVAFQRGSFDSAVADFQEALRVRERNGDSAGVAQVLGRIVVMLGNRKNVDSAARVLTRIFRIDSILPSVDSVQYATLLGDRATLESLDSKYAASIHDAHASLAILRRLLPANDPRVANGIYTLGVVFDGGHALDSAAVQYRRAVALTEHIFGPDHPETARRLAKAGQALAEIGFTAEGLAMTKRALAIRGRLAGPDSLDVANTLISVANVYQFMDSLAASLPYYRRAIAIFGRSATPDPTDLHYGLEDLGVALNGLKRFREAVAPLRRDLAIADSLLPPIDLALVQQVLGVSLMYTGHRSEAERLFRRALTLVDSVAGPNDVNVTYDLWSLGDLYMREHRYAEAAAAYRRMIPVLAVTRGKNNPSGMADALQSLAGALRADHDTVAADSFTAQARALRQSRRSPP